MNSSNIQIYRLDEDSNYGNGYKLGLLCKERLTIDFYIKVKEKLYHQN